MEQTAFAAQDSGQLVVKFLGIQLAGDAEAGRVMQDRIGELVGSVVILLGDVPLSQSANAPPGWGDQGLRLRSQRTSEFFS